MQTTNFTGRLSYLTIFKRQTEMVYKLPQTNPLEGGFIEELFEIGPV